MEAKPEKNGKFAASLRQIDRLQKRFQRWRLYCLAAKLKPAANFLPSNLRKSRIKISKHQTLIKAEDFGKSKKDVAKQGFAKKNPDGEDVSHMKRRSDFITSLAIFNSSLVCFFSQIESVNSNFLMIELAIKF